MQTFLIVGKNFSGLRDKILERGDEYILLQDIHATKKPDAQLKRRVVVDFKDAVALQSAVAALKGKVDAVFANYEHYVLPAARIAEQLGLPGMPVASAEACTDKYLMRGLFAKAPVKISPAYKIADTLETALQFGNEHGYPLIIKPANLAKSLLVYKCIDPADLTTKYNATVASINEVYDKYAPGRTPKIIIEEFMEGPIFSVDAFVNGVGEPKVLEQVVDYQTGYDIGFNDNFHYSRIIPSKLKPEQITAIRACATNGIKALGMKNSPAHVEIILTKAGPRIVEIGARNGGYRDRMHGMANGIDILGNALNLALGKEANVQATKNEPCAVLELFPKKSGIFNGLKNAEKLKELPSLEYLNIKAKEGDFIGLSSEGYKMTAVIILQNSSTEQFSKDLDYVNNHVYVRTS